MLLGLYQNTHPPLPLPHSPVPDPHSPPSLLDLMCLTHVALVKHIKLSREGGEWGWSVGDGGMECVCERQWPILQMQCLCVPYILNQSSTPQCLITELPLASSMCPTARQPQ